MAPVCIQQLLYPGQLKYIAAKLYSRPPRNSFAKKEEGSLKFFSFCANEFGYKKFISSVSRRLSKMLENLWQWHSNIM